MNAPSAALVVASAVSALSETENYLIRDEPWSKYMFNLAVDAALGDGTSRLPIPTTPTYIDSVGLQQIVFTAQDCATRRLWQQNRIVYDVDAELWNELGDIDEDTVVPARVFAHLAHPNPFIRWPNAPAYPLRDGWKMRSIGCFVTGASGTHIEEEENISNPRNMLGWPVSTHSEYASGNIVITTMSFVELADGKPRYVPELDNIVDAVVSRVTLKVGGSGEVRIGDLIDAIGTRYETNDVGTGFEDSVRPMLRRIISVLLYLCATNADLRPLPAAATRRAVQGTRMAAKPPRAFQVGYVVGAGLRAWRRRQAAGTRADELPTSLRRPHIRRAHPHLYWTGEGRKIPRVRWLFPIRVNAHLGDSTTSVQPVKGKERK
jgi:hypothetical protein